MADELTDEEVFAPTKELTDDEVFNQSVTTPVAPEQPPSAMSPAEEKGAVVQAAQDHPVLENAAGAVADIVQGIPTMATQAAKGVVDAMKFQVGTPQQQAQAVADLAGQATGQGKQLASDVQSPLGSRESFRGLAQLGMMAAPALGLKDVLFGEKAPPVQGSPASLTDVLFPKQESPPIQELTAATEKEVPNASQITIPDSVTQPEVRPQVGESAPLRQQGETPEARQGTEAQPAQEVVPPEIPTSGETPPATPEAPITEGLPEPAGRMTGLTKDYISEDRAARGEEPLSQQARIGNEESWDKAESAFQANPNAGHDLVKDLTDNPRAATPDDLGVLLRHRVNLANETDLFSEKALKPDIPAPEKAEALQRLAALQDARNDADVVTRSMGATAGRSLQFLKQLSDQDYSLSSMLQERRVAMGGKPITPDKIETFTKQTEQYSQDLLRADQELQNYTKTQSRAASSLQAYKARLEGATTELERRQAFSDYEPEIRKQLELDPEAIRLKANFEKVKNAYQKQLYKDTQANKPFWQKALGFASFVARESALSGIETLGKLAQFTGAKLAEIPMTETAERVWGKVPGFREISQTSEFGPGANAKQLGEFYKEFATTGMKEAWQMLKGEGSATRLALEKEKRVGWPSFFGFLHGVEKTPLLIASQRMNRLKLMQSEMSKLSSEAIAKGQDVSNPLTQGAINYKAFQRSTYDILQEQNDFASLVKSSMARMEAVKKTTGEVNATQAVMATLARVFLTKDIVRVPSNYIKQTLERTPLGLARGVGGAARAWYKGVGNVSPAERTAIMKLMGTGSIGSGFFVWGAIDAMKSPDQRTFGGYYQPGEKRDKTGDVSFGKIRPFGHELPHLATHNPMTESAQMGSTMMRVALSAISKKDLTNRGVAEGIIKSIFGLAEQAPISGQAFRLSKVGEPGGPTSVVGEAIRGLIPQFIQNIAKWGDQGEKRKPRTAVETMKLGIPGLRQQVPEKETEKPKADRRLRR